MRVFENRQFSRGRDRWQWTGGRTGVFPPSRAGFWLFPRVPCRDLIPAWGRNVRFGLRRFWCPHGESIVLTAGGFLLDPHVRKTTAVGVDAPLQLSFQDIEPAARFAQTHGQRVLEEPAQKVSHGC